MSPTPAQVRVAKVSAVSAVLVAAIGLGGTWLANRKANAVKPSPGYLTVVVLDDSGKTGLEDAQTDLSIGGINHEGRTDSTGRHIFELEPTLVGKVGVVQVSKPGYSPRRIEMAIAAGGDSKEIFLAKAPAQIAEINSEQIVATPLRNRVRPVAITGTQSSISDVSSTSEHAVTSSARDSTSPTITKSTIAPSDLPDSEVEIVTETFRSGPRASGMGRNFSDWYTLCSPTLPPGSEIIKTSYRLEGDRQCGAWSECRLGETSPTRVCLEFRLQGHDEVVPPRTFESEGYLTVAYRKPK